ncbi:unnamed protein product [Ranitomeya imitator]|uniref:Uncharacterized protein n=1 Tax=Ranitomeya imitator TaxID=111125 RepID=A0ABN9KZ04_9NEOB|nr:unnamed protein product [Ranitomeya imitator]
MLGVPEDGSGFDYGFKLKEEKNDDDIVPDTGNDKNDQHPRKKIALGLTIFPIDNEELVYATKSQMRKKKPRSNSPSKESKKSHL